LLCDQTPVLDPKCNALVVKRNATFSQELHVILTSLFGDKSSRAALVTTSSMRAFLFGVSSKNLNYEA
jgi:hypothetical protein